MRHTPAFAKFLGDVVNLPQGRLDQLKGNVDAIFEALQNADTLGPLVLDKIPQGSWPHRTIIRPVDDLEFDADFLLLLIEHPDWSEDPEQYLQQLEAALRTHGRYADMVDDDVKSRCVRVIYADEHHVDIVPYLILANGRKVIVNRDINDWEDTDPEGFTTWMRDNDKRAKGNMRKIIRLLKYLRDYHDAFPDVPSIVITALTGATITDANRIEGKYSDIPSTLYQVMVDLDDQLQRTVTKPTIPDPSGVADPNGVPVTFDHRWDEATYQAFRTNIHRYRGKIAAAYLEPDEAKSLELWAEVFGDRFTSPASKATSHKRLGSAAPVPASTSSSRGG